MANPSIKPGAAPANAARMSRVQFLDYLATYADYRGFKHFDIADNDIVEDRVAPILSQASCLLMLLSATFVDTGQLRAPGRASQVDSLDPEIMSGALAGINSLVALGAMLLEGVEAANG